MCCSFVTSVGSLALPGRRSEVSTGLPTHPHTAFRRPRTRRSRVRARSERCARRGEDMPGGSACPKVKRFETFDPRVRPARVGDLQQRSSARRLSGCGGPHMETDGLEFHEDSNAQPEGRCWLPSCHQPAATHPLGAWNGEALSHATDFCSTQICRITRRSRRKRDPPRAAAEMLVRRPDDPLRFICNFANRKQGLAWTM